MIIGIDGNEANIERKVGIGQYAFQVLKHLEKFQISNFKFQNNKDKFVIYLKDQPRQDLPAEKPWWKYKAFGPQGLWTQFTLPFHLFTDRERPDVFFTPSHYAPRFSPCPTVISIMDLSFINYPELFAKKDLYQLRSWTAYSVKRAAKVLTISEFSKKEIVSYYQIPKDKVVVTYPGYDKKKFRIMNYELSAKGGPAFGWRIKNKKNIEDKFHIDGEYILFVGTLQPRKNIVRLIEAFHQLRTNNNEFRTLKLVIVGKKGWLYEDIFNKVETLKLEKEVVFSGFVKNEDLQCLYQSARCFVLPSLYEGFGIPVVEAMACGCPVVASNVSSLPEVAGDAAILINPYDTDNIAAGIREAASNNVFRQQLIKKGLARVKLFNWEKCADTTFKVLSGCKI